MKPTQFIFLSHLRTAGPALLAVLCLASIGCAPKDVSRPTGAPVSYDPTIRRDPGVINEPSNSGNSPQDLSPYSPRWGDVRPY